MINTELILPRKFYERDTVLVARELLGKLLVRVLPNQVLSGKITEVEAYLPYTDPAAHSYKGITVRNRSLFGEAGRAYIHRMHGWHLLDITTEVIKVPGSVLIRGLVPVHGFSNTSNESTKEQLVKLMNGPGKVCETLHIDHSLDGVDITNTNCGLFVTDNKKTQSEYIVETPRIGLSKATEFNLRFLLMEK